MSTQSYNCECGGTLNFTTEQTIVVNDFPHHVCSKCGEYEFNIKENLIKCLEYALEHNMDQISYIQIKSYIKIKQII